jgi:allantoate deiminase
LTSATQFDATAAAQMVLERCAILARCTEQSGVICRTFLSSAMDEAQAHLRKWMEQAGLSVKLDRAGNILASTNTAPNLARLLIGSHLDTVPDAGPYDGVLGVLLALALAEDRHMRTRSFAVDVIGFSEEEGVRFAAPFLGSKALTGGLGSELLSRRDLTGLTLQGALQQFEAAHPEAIAPSLSNDTRGYLEFHTEQGPVLDSLRLPLGVVTAIAGQTRGAIAFTGRAGHAGTTPMTQRQDALATAAEWVAKVEQLALATHGLVATVGQIVVEPGVVNVIPALARCSLDLRHVDDEVRERALSQILKSAEDIAARRSLKCNWCLNHTQPAVPMNPQMILMAECAIERAGYPIHRIASGAGHDAMVLAPHLPSGMIFLRSPGGLSHHPDETVLVADVAAAIAAGINFLDEFERAVCAGEIAASA